MSEAFNPAASITITGADNIRAASLIALRGALRLEVRGLKRRGRSARAIANEHMGTNLRTAKATYPVFDAWLVAQYPGRIGSRPLD
jgi:hypothetical protein